MIYCTCNVSVPELLTELYEKSSVRYFQVFNKVTAKNIKIEPRLNNPVWRGYNSSVLIMVNEEDKVKDVILFIREHNKSEIYMMNSLTCVPENCKTIFMIDLLIYLYISADLYISHEKS